MRAEGVCYCVDVASVAVGAAGSVTVVSVALVSVIVTDVSVAAGSVTMAVSVAVVSVAVAGSPAVVALFSVHASVPATRTATAANLRIVFICGSISLHVKIGLNEAGVLNRL